MSKVKDQEFLVHCGDWNSHIGQLAEGFQGEHDGLAFGERKMEGERLLEFISYFDVVVTNSFLGKCNSP